MAFSDWMEIYRTYSSEELDEEVAQLKKDLKGSYSGQGVGAVNFQRDLSMLQSRLQAIARIRNEQANAINSGVGQVDFGNVRWGDV